METDIDPDILSLDIITGLKGYWKFDEASGNVATDSSGNGNVGTLINNPTRITGKVGKALEFDKTYNQEVQVNASSTLNFVNPLTIAMWVKPIYTGDSTPGTHRRIIAKYTNSSNHYQIGIDGNTRQILTRIDYIGNAYRTMSNSVIPLDIYSHLAVTFDTGITKIYINGSLTTTTAVGITNTKSGDTNLHISGLPDVSNFFNGQLDEVRIYNRTLTATDVMGLTINCIPPSIRLTI